eukprot:scaffold13838_cov189-Ochromonas_danica.AAC.1
MAQSYIQLMALVALIHLARFCHSARNSFQRLITGGSGSGPTRGNNNRHHHHRSGSSGGSIEGRHGHYVKGQSVRDIAAYLQQGSIASNATTEALAKSIQAINTMSQQQQRLPTTTTTTSIGDRLGTPTATNLMMTGSSSGGGGGGGSNANNTTTTTTTTTNANNTELCIRALYNISCELKPGSSSYHNTSHATTTTTSGSSGVGGGNTPHNNNSGIGSGIPRNNNSGSNGGGGGGGGGVEKEYANKFSSLKIIHILIHRLLSSPNMIVLEMININTQQSPVQALPIIATTTTNTTSNTTSSNANNNNVPPGSAGGGGGNGGLHSENKLSDALYRVYALDVEESTYCAVVTLYNISKLPESRVLADSKAIPLCVD